MEPTPLRTAAALASCSLLVLLAPLLAPYLSPAPASAPSLSLTGALHPGPTALEAALVRTWREAAARARARLEAALASPPPLAPSPGSAFADVLEAAPLQPFLSHFGSDSDVTGERAIAFAPQLRARRGGLIAYGAGIATDGRFEHSLASSLGCEVHGFDCTLSRVELAAARARYNFTLHGVCVGAPGAIGGDYTRGQSGLRFLPLQRIRQTLGHAAAPLDVLKMDIEGGEWALLESEVLAPGLRPQALPRQLLFELHTEGANAAYVAPSLVQGKGRAQVAALFLRLLDVGFHVVTKVVNPGDDKCADFVLVREAPSAEAEEGKGDAEGGRWGGAYSPWDE